MTKARTLADNFAADINQVDASSPLTGGGTSGTVTVGIQDGTTSQKGAVQLEDSTASTSTTKASTPNSVKSAYDLANGAIAKSIVDAKGDLIVATGSDTVSRLAVASTAGYLLSVDSAESTGLKWAAPAGGGPYAGARIGADQTLSAATLTKLNFNTEDWDSDSCYNTTDKRFTPNKSGKYQVIAHTVMYDGPEYRLLIYKNGAEDCLLDIVDYTINDLNPILQGTKTISMNGTTDYLEIYGFMRAGSTRRVNAGGSWFQISYIGA